MGRINSEFMRISRETQLQFGVTSFRDVSNALSIGPVPGFHFALADRAELLKLGAAPDLTRFFVMLPFAELVFQAAPFQQFFEPAESGADSFPVVNTHPERHFFSLKLSGLGIRKGRVFRLI
jgi:hypothetical protein